MDVMCLFRLVPLPYMYHAFMRITAMAIDLREERPFKMVRDTRVRVFEEVKRGEDNSVTQNCGIKTVVHASSSHPNRRTTTQPHTCIASNAVPRKKMALRCNKPASSRGEFLLFNG
jgi:hypothetical protein